MSEIANIKRKIFGKNTFTNVVDTSFTQLVPKDSTEPVTTPVTLESFFDDYDTIFYDIPPSGSIQSHEEIVKRSGEYIGINIVDLQAEIDNLRNENVSLKTQLFNLTTTK